MKARNTLPIILIALVSAGALVTTGTVHETAVVDTTMPVLQRPHDLPAVLAHHGNRDAVAVHDITLHAVGHFGTAEVQSESLHVWPDWTPEWELRYVPLDGGTEGVYHATNKLHPEIRFTVTVGSDEPASREWKRAD